MSAKDFRGTEGSVIPVCNNSFLSETCVDGAAGVHTPYDPWLAEYVHVLHGTMSMNTSYERLTPPKERLTIRIVEV
jgi:hypothetical protein